MRTFIAIYLLLLFQACQLYHDTTSRFNAHFLAQEKMKEVEAAMLSAISDDYTQILQVFPRIDSASGVAHQSALEYVIEKASLPIKLHERSKWVDDCYLLIGKARLYLGDFRNAANTFKYINTKSTDPNARHAALVWLQRLFIEQGNDKDALYVAEYLSKEDYPVSNANARDFYLNMAHYYRLKQDLPRTAAYLEKSLPYIVNKEMRIRALFIVAQISQQLGQIQKAHQYYSQLIRHNPPYEMLFLAQLHLASAVDFNDATAVEKAQKSFRSMLKDPKNAEYATRIWYEAGNFELQCGNIEKAISAWQRSIASATQPQQKAAAYLQLAQAYYEQLQDYEKASSYYDSAAQTLSPSASNYELVKKRSEILKEFAAKRRQVEQAERLLKLYGMNQEQRHQFLQKEIQEEKAAIDKQLKENSTASANKPIAPKNTSEPFPTQSGGSTWYFYNAQTVANGKTAFVRTWGNIPLADYWRLSDKVRDALADDLNSYSAASNPKDNSTASPQADKYASVQSIESRLAEIPSTEAEAEQLKQKMAEGLYHTGKMYFQFLDEPQKARANLLRFLELAPTHPKVPEVLYTLARICDTETARCQPEEYTQLLLEKYPQSAYAQLLRKDKAQDATASNSQAAIQVSTALLKDYAAAYELYQTGYYQQALEAFSAIEKQYADNPFGEQVSMLKILSQLGLAPNSSQAVSQLEAFISTARQNELIEMAKTLLQKIQENKQP